MNKLKEKTYGLQWFIKLNLKNSYYHIRIKKSDEWKMAFKMKYSLYQYTVMSFGHINKPFLF